MGSTKSTLLSQNSRERNRGPKNAMKSIGARLATLHISEDGKGPGTDFARQFLQ
jgi:hypothetical protein